MMGRGNRDEKTIGIERIELEGIAIQGKNVSQLQVCRCLEEKGMGPYELLVLGN